MSKEERELKKGERAYFQRFINDFIDESKKALSEIDKLKKKIVEGDEESISFATIEEYKDKLSTLHDEIFDQDEDGNTIEDIVSNFKSEIKTEEKEINEIKKTILKYEEKLFGKEDEDGNKATGIEKKINLIQKQLSDNLKQNDEKQKALLSKIEELLEGASTVALAKAFHDHKKEFDKPNLIWSITFVSTLAVLMSFTLISYFTSGVDIKDMWKITLGNLPFIGGGVWLAIFASKQRSQNIRLQQEYSYKEDVAKLYYGLKGEIEQLDNTDLGKKLNESVISILVETVSYNPSATLDNNSHNDKGPILESLKGISEALKK